METACLARAREAECASRKKIIRTGRAVFFITPQSRELLQEMALVYDESASGGLLGGVNTFGYVAGNPLSMVDFFGLLANLSDAECAQLEKDIGLEKDTIKKLKQMMVEGKDFSDYGLTPHADSDGYVNNDAMKNKSQTYQDLVHQLENDSARTRSDKIDRVAAIILTLSINKGKAVVEKNRSETILKGMDDIFCAQCKQQQQCPAK